MYGAEPETPIEKAPVEEAPVEEASRDSSTMLENPVELHVEDLEDGGEGSAAD